MEYSPTPGARPPLNKPPPKEEEDFWTSSTQRPDRPNLFIKTQDNPLPPPAAAPSTPPNPIYRYPIRRYPVPPGQFVPVPLVPHPLGHPIPAGYPIHVPPGYYAMPPAPGAPFPGPYGPQARAMHYFQPHLHPVMRNFTTTSDECPLPIPAGPSPGYGPPEALNRSGERGAIVLRHAMMGGGADTEALMRTLIDKDPFQVAQIRESFIYLYRRSVEFDINTETEGGFANGLLALIRGPLDNDVQLLDDMKDQPRAKAKVMNDVLLGRSNADLRAIKRAFQQAFNQTLEDVLLSSQFFDAGAHFKIVLGAERAEESEPVLETSVERDVQAIYDVTDGAYRIDSDEDGDEDEDAYVTLRKAEERPKPDRTPISIIMSQRNDSQIRAIAERYRQLHARTLEDLFVKHFQGSLQAALLFQLRHAMNKPVHRAMLLAEAIEAIEADWDFQEQLLISRIVRYHWNPNDMRAVRAAFNNLYRRSLSKQLSREPQEAYRRLLLGCIGALPISEEPPASPASDLSAEAWPHPDEHRAPGNIGAAASWDFHLYRVPPPAPPTTGKDVLREPGRLGH